MALEYFAVWYVVLCEIAHFVFAFIVGWLGFWLMSTTLLRIRCLGGQRTPGDSCIYRFSFLFALLLSIWAHVLEDYKIV